MAQPTRTQVHVDKPLTNISVAYTQDANAFIADKVFPIVQVAKQSDKYFVFDSTTFMRDDAKKRGNSEESVGSGYGLSTDSYFCDKYALHKDISDDIRINTDSPLDADRNAVQFITHQLLLRRERQWASDYFAVSVWGTTVVGASTLQWDNYASSDPIKAVDAAKRQIVAATGRMPNKMVLGMDVFLALKEHPDVVDRIKYTSDRTVTEGVLARLLGLESLYVPYAVLDTGSEGKTASSVDFAISSKSALLVHAPSSGGLEIPSAGYIFSWAGEGRQFGLGMKKFRLEHLESDRVEGSIAFDCKVVGTPLGCFFSNIVS